MRPVLSVRAVASTLFALGVLAACGASASGTTANPCADLGVCCATMTGASAGTCSDVAGAGDESSCTDALAAYTSEGTCSAGGGGTMMMTSTGSCAPLEACCSKLSGVVQSACLGIVSDGVVETCESELATLQGESLCGTSVVVTIDAGHDTGLSTHHDAAFGAPDVGVVKVPDATAPPDVVVHPKDTGTDSEHCGTCGAECLDSCGHACTGGLCKQVCTAHCTADIDCEDSCPATAGVINCCDLTTDACYTSSASVCPAPPTDAGHDAGGY